MEKVFVSESNALSLRRTKTHWVGRQTQVWAIVCRVLERYSLELLQVLAKTNSSAKTITLPMTLSQLLFDMNLSTRSVPTSNQLVSWLMKPIQARMKGFKAVKKE